MRTVSISDSPFDTDEADAVMLTTSAERFFAATSKLTARAGRCLVEQDRARVLPRSAGTFAMGRRSTSRIESVVASQLDLGPREIIEVEQMPVVPGRRRKGRLRNGLVAGPDARGRRGGLGRAPAVPPADGADDTLTPASCDDARRDAPLDQHAVLAIDFFEVTRTISSRDVGTFLPTWSARMGSSRWPRSTSTARRMARGRPKSTSASIAARIVRPVNRTSSTRTIVDR